MDPKEQKRGDKKNHWLHLKNKLNNVLMYTELHSFVSLYLFGDEL